MGHPTMQENDTAKLTPTDIPSLIIFMNQIISLRPLQVHRL